MRARKVGIVHIELVEVVEGAELADWQRALQMQTPVKSVQEIQAEDLICQVQSCISADGDRVCLLRGEKILFIIPSVTYLGSKLRDGIISNQTFFPLRAMFFVKSASVLQRRTCMPGGGGARQVKVCDPAVDADAAAGALSVCIRKQPDTATAMTPHKTFRSLHDWRLVDV